MKPLSRKYTAPPGNSWMGWGEVIQLQGPNQTGSQTLVTDTAYDSTGQAVFSGRARTVSSSGGSYYAPTWPSIPHTTAAYDALGRPKLVTYADGSQEQTYYGYAWTSYVDQNGHVTVTVKDELGRLARDEEYTGSYPGTLTLYNSVTYSYDELDRLIGVKDTANSQGITTIAYDGFGRKQSMSDLDLGSGTHKWTYLYDVLGNLLTQTDARGCAISVDYDSLNRPRHKNYYGPGACGSTPSVTFNYDETPDMYHTLRGYRTSMVDGTGTTHWDYDGQGQIRHQESTVFGVNSLMNSYNDAFGRPSLQYLPNGESINYTYNPAGTLEWVIRDRLLPIRYYL